MYEAYPEQLIIICLVVGGVISLFHPYWTFLAGSFCLAALNLTASFLTRSILGPYFNLTDAILLVMLLALVVHITKDHQRIRFPKPAILILVIWTIGMILGLMRAGWQYEVLREIRWALNFPLAIIISANFIDKNPDTSRNFVKALFFGAIVGAIQHLLQTRSAISDIQISLSLDSELNNIRNIGFLFSPIALFFIVATVRPLLRQGKGMQILWWIALLLFTTSILLNQTRSLWFAIIMTILALSLLLKTMRNLIRFVVIASVLLIALQVVFQLFLPQLTPLQILTSRYQSLADETIRYQTTLTRINAIQVEGMAWLYGSPLSIFFGNGLGYRWENSWVDAYGSTGSEGVAWGHVGYISYLSNLGLLGFLVYGVYLQVFGISMSLRLYNKHKIGPFADIALLGLVSSVLYAIMFAMSSSYLMPHVIVAGMLLGGVYGVMVNIKDNDARIMCSTAEKREIDKALISSTPGLNTNKVAIPSQYLIR